jgi:hypothetical protein
VLDRFFLSYSPYSSPLALTVPVNFATRARSRIAASVSTIIFCKFEDFPLKSIYKAAEGLPVSNFKLWEDGMLRVTVFSVAAAVFLVGCGQSPQEKCSSTTSYSELRVLGQKIKQSKIDIERGYKVHYSKQPSSYSGSCSTNVPGSRPIYYSCMKNSTITVESPVSIDVAVERRNLKLYERSYDRLYPKATRAYNSCLERS